LEKQNFFTLDEAKQKIPWLEIHLQEIVSLSKHIERLKLEMDKIFRKISSNGHGSTDQDMAGKRKETDDAVNRVSKLVQGINDLGIIVRDTERGLVDFPAFLEGREVCLCWILGESTIQFWHEIDTGVSGRQPLA
jgi:hypothetical protein